MFPFANPSGQAEQYNNFQIYLPFQYTPNMQIPQVSNYFYFFPQSDFQPNMVENHIFQATHPQNKGNQGFKPFYSQPTQKNDEQRKNVSKILEKTEIQAPSHAVDLEKQKPISKEPLISRSTKRGNSDLAKKRKLTVKYAEQQYSVQNLKPCKKVTEQDHLYLKYRKKNTESNIVNRIFSFLKIDVGVHRELAGLKLTEEKKHIFLLYLNCVQESWKAPMKRHIILCLMHVSQNLPGFKQMQKIEEKHPEFSIIQFQRYLRTVVINYLDRIAPITVITSKKMKRAVWRQHLEKIRELKEYFLNNER